MAKSKVLNFEFIAFFLVLPPFVYSVPPASTVRLLQMRALLHAPAAASVSPAMTGMQHAGHGASPVRHGTLEGHVLPGLLFLIWGAWSLNWRGGCFPLNRSPATWWVVAFLRAWSVAVASRAGFATPPWFPAGWLLLWPRWSSLTFLERAEPALKFLLPCAGLLDELVPWTPLSANGVLLHPPIHGRV